MAGRECMNLYNNNNNNNNNSLFLLVNSVHVLHFYIHVGIVKRFHATSSLTNKDAIKSYVLSTNVVVNGPKIPFY